MRRKVVKVLKEVIYFTVVAFLFFLGFTLFLHSTGQKVILPIPPDWW